MSKYYCSHNFFYLTPITGEAGASFSGPKSKNKKNLLHIGFPPLTNGGRPISPLVTLYSFIILIYSTTPLLCHCPHIQSSIIMSIYQKSCTWVWTVILGPRLKTEAPASYPVALLQSRITQSKEFIIKMEGNTGEFSYISGSEIHEGRSVQSIR